MTPAKGRGGARKAATSARPPEAAAFEKEYPGSSWLCGQVFRALEVVGTLAESRIASVAQRYGLSHASLNALAVIEGNGAPMAVGEVSARMHVTSGTMTGVLDTLEKSHYVERLTDPDDRRRVLVEVTPAAQALLDRLLPDVAQTTTHVLADVTDAQLRELLVTLGRVREVLLAAPEVVSRPAPRRTPPNLKRARRRG